MLRSSSFLKRTVCTPEIALTTVDLPCATWPIVPMLIVACREITSGESALSVFTSSLLRSCTASCGCVTCLLSDMAAALSRAGVCSLEWSGDARYDGDAAC